MDRVLQRVGLMIAAAGALVLLPAASIRVAQDGGPAGSSPAVAVVEGAAITLEEFQGAYSEYLSRSGLQDNLALRKMYLANMVTNRLIVLHARENGADEDAEYRRAEEESRRYLLIEAYLHRAVYDTLRVREADVRSMFERVNTRLSARHLYARTAAEAQRLHARLLNGESFEALARETFADAGLANSGGSIGSFGFDEMDPAFEDAAYALEVGETSAPVGTKLGYSIIQLTARERKTVLPDSAYIKAVPKLRRYVQHRKREAARTDLVLDLTRRLDASFTDASLERLLAGSALREQAPAGWEQEPLVAFTAGVERRTWTVADFLEAVRYTRAEARQEVRTREDLAEFIQGLAVRSILLERARGMRLQDSPEYHRALAAVTDEWLLERERERLTSEVDVPEDSMRAYFARYAGEFVSPPRVEVWEILADRKATLDSLKPAATPAAFEALARAHSVRPGAAEAGGYLGYVGATQLGVLAGAVFGARQHDVLGPLEIGGRYVLLLVGARQDSAPMAYEEARPEIARRLRDPLVKQRTSEYLLSLRSRYKVEIHNDVLASLHIAV